MSSRREGGFTLIELMVALLVSSIVIATALALMMAQQRAFRRGEDERRIQEAGRIAIDDLTSNLRLAGFGIDPALAFDFGAMTSFPMPESAAVGGGGSTTGYACASKVTCRDSTTGPDEIVFRMRDPRFGHRMTKAPAGDTIYIDGPLANPLLPGQVLQIACGTGSLSWAYVTVDTKVNAVTTATDVSVKLRAATGSVYPLQNEFLTKDTSNCFKAYAGIGSATSPTPAAQIDNSAKVLKVDLYRYHVAAYGGRPYLMLDQGLGSETVVAPDVEDLQFVYLFPNSSTPLAGNSTALTDSTTGIDMSASPVPSFVTSSTDTARTTHHPANIRGVIVRAVVRAPQETTPAAADLTTVPAAANRATLSGQPAYRRFLIETTVDTRNLDSRGPYYPAWSAGTGDTLNKGGG